jgi:hypothetical protein
MRRGWEGAGVVREVWVRRIWEEVVCSGEECPSELCLRSALFLLGARKKKGAAEPRLRGAARPSPSSQRPPVLPCTSCAARLLVSQQHVRGAVRLEGVRVRKPL